MTISARASLPIMLLVSLAQSPCLAQEAKQDITQSYLEWIVRNLDLVIQGQIKNIEEKYIARRELYGRGSDEPNMIITEIMIQIEKVIAGTYLDDEIAIILTEGEINGVRSVMADYSPMQAKVGDQVLVCIELNARGTGHHIIKHRRAFFRLDGDNLVPYQREYRLAVDKPMEVIANKAKERELPQIFKAADLICIGTVTRLIDPASARKEINVSVDEILKGTEEESSISVDVAEVNRSFKHQRPGFHVLLFLKRDNYGYKTVEGVNGYYVVKGDLLYRGITQPMNFGVSELKGNIKVWKEIEQ